MIAAISFNEQLKTNNAQNNRRNNRQCLGINRSRNETRANRTKSGSNMHSFIVSSSSFDAISFSIHAGLLFFHQALLTLWIWIFISSFDFCFGFAILLIFRSIPFKIIYEKLWAVKWLKSQHKLVTLYWVDKFV